MKQDSSTTMPSRHPSPGKVRATNQTDKSIAVVPRFVSQHTANAVLGFRTGRAFLEWLPTSGCRVVERGKDRLVLLEEAEQALLALAGGAESVGEVAAAETLTVDGILARLGRRSAGAP